MRGLPADPEFDVVVQSPQLSVQFGLRVKHRQAPFAMRPARVRHGCARSGPASHQIRGLLDRVAVSVVEGDRCPLPDRQAAVCTIDVDDLGGAPLTTPRSGRLEEFEWRPASRAEAPAHAGAVVHADAGQPAREVIAVPDGRPRSPCLEQRLLHRVLGLAIVPEDGERECVQRLASVATRASNASSGRDSLLVIRLADPITPLLTLPEAILLTRVCGCFRAGFWR